MQRVRSFPGSRRFSEGPITAEAGGWARGQGQDRPWDRRGGCSRSGRSPAVQADACAASGLVASAATGRCVVPAPSAPRLAARDAFVSPFPIRAQPVILPAQKPAGLGSSSRGAAKSRRQGPRRDAKPRFKLAGLGTSGSTGRSDVESSTCWFTTRGSLAECSTAVRFQTASRLTPLLRSSFGTCVTNTHKTLVSLLILKSLLETSVVCIAMAQQKETRRMADGDRSPRVPFPTVRCRCEGAVRGQLWPRQLGARQAAPHMPNCSQSCNK